MESGGAAAGGRSLFALFDTVMFSPRKFARDMPGLQCTVQASQVQKDISEQLKGQRDDRTMRQKGRKGNGIAVYWTAEQWALGQWDSGARQRGSCLQCTRYQNRGRIESRWSNQGPIACRRPEYIEVTV